MSTTPREVLRPVEHWKQVTGRHRATILRWSREGLIPPPQKINGRNYWRESDFDAFLKVGPKAGEA